MRLVLDSNTSSIAQNVLSAFSQSGKLNPSALLSNSPADKKLHKAAGEFESLLLSSLWKSMKTTFSDPDPDSEDPAHDSFEEMGIDAMAGAVGKAGGLGLGKLILKHLEPQLLQSQNGIDPNSGKVSNQSADTSQ